MAQCKLTPREFISNAFSPQIGAVCSAAADAVCQKNNLSFIELLQPFCNLTTEGHIKDPQGSTIAVRNLRLSIQDIYGQPPEPSVARKMLNDSVSSEQCERTTSIRIGSTDLDIPLSVPWFESWREMFLNVQFPSDHEFTKHFLACMIVVSTADDNPLEKIQQMAAQLHQSTPGKLPKWFNNNALRYYILIYDGAQDEKAKAESVFTEMKNLYDANNCFLLQMNSRPPGQMDDNMYLPDPWSQFLVKYTDLTSSDHSSSPRTPADTGGVSAMPNQVTSGTDKPSSQAGTPVAPQNPVLLSPDITDKISLSSEISEVVSIPVEVAQEVVPVTIHPLSPDSEKRFSSFSDSATKSQYQPLTGSPINANVWADSPSRPIAQHGARLSTQDLERIRSLVTEFCIKSLLPYVEKQIGLLNDVISNKKGVSRSLFSATKRWFGTSKPGAPGSAPSNAVIYSLESSELQLRRLGDLCFMFGHYTLAYQAYHSAKRDFAADQAWLYYAGALEMAALSAFMQGEMTRKTVEYMDDAILTYSNSCKMPQFATRATILSAECLKGRNLYGDAAKQLIRMTSEDSDLRSALLLEQAAYCFISSKMMHKYAFHAVLAGHRFSKAGQRKHSLRCYQQAYQVYSNKGWALAEDHIHFTIGRQAASLKQVEESVRAFEKLLSPCSKQPAVQQAAFLREFLHINNLVIQQVPAHFNGLPILPLPLIDGNEIKVLLGPIGDKDYDLFDQDDTEVPSRWSKLEETLVTEAQGSAPMIFKPSVALYSKKSNNTSKPNAIVEEPIHLSVELHNPLRISIPLYKIKLIWSFTKDGQTVSNETMSENSLSDFSSVDTKVVESVVLQPSSKLRVFLSCTPTQMGELKILGISYSLANANGATNDLPVVNPSIMIHGKRLFEIRGPKLKNVKEKPDAIFYGVDYRLDINVVDKAPFMQVSFTKVITDMLCGEMQRVEVTLKNIGSAPLTNIFVGSTDARLFCLERGLDSNISNNLVKNNCVTRIVSEKEIFVGESLKVPLWIRAPAEKGSHRLDLLFYYENPRGKSVPRYRVSRHSWQLQVSNSVEIKTIVRPSAVTKDNLPTMNLVVQVKNSNQSHEPLRNEVTLTKMSLKSESWKLVAPAVDSFKYKIQPQETCHLLLKLSRRFNDESVWSDVSLSESDGTSIANTPYAEFVEKRFSSQEAGESNQILGFNSPLVDTVKLGATMILRWRAKVMEGETVVRETTGQHHVDLELVNKMYKHPEDALTEPSEYSTRLKIFGPDRNIPDSNSVVKKDAVDESELQKNVITYSLGHSREIEHEFERNQICIVPVTLNLQNNSHQLYLPSVKSQLYVPQASTYFRYARHTTICCQIESYKRHSVKLQAVISSPGTYDLASRLDLSARLEQFDNFVPQKWRLESVCTVSEVHS
ncbi:Similar to TRAPPC8: Trafficking protein particle complex subunit 8 (Homo sapiens) [Cotesia congregata]|uniref:Similar to TRAPPC8: Trafficking protein particle complex subunit 8 (Homo sapiens) n=1 Tax=Cotesia congregata TaxID=51543 RepID=A0A8J2MP89_COTCN|nr:Similar to TRAPPC8: Trafficking protein particle complex subunit 8 (Homo sapiens) [Cotesia congregata]